MDLSDRHGSVERLAGVHRSAVVGRRKDHTSLPQSDHGRLARPDSGIPGRVDLVKLEEADTPCVVSDGDGGHMCCGIVRGMAVAHLHDSHERFAGATVAVIGSAGPEEIDGRTGPPVPDFRDLSRGADATARLASQLELADPNALVAVAYQVRKWEVPQPS